MHASHELRYHECEATNDRKISSCNGTQSCISVIEGHAGSGQARPRTIGRDEASGSIRGPCPHSAVKVIAWPTTDGFRELVSVMLAGVVPAIAKPEHTTSAETGSMELNRGDDSTHSNLGLRLVPRLLLQRFLVSPCR